MEAEYLTIADHDDQAVSVLSSLNYRISQLERASQVSLATAPQLQPIINATASTPSLPRLPKLEITPFRGDLHKWSSFWEQFEGTIHNNASVSINDKFHYLRKYLVGDAAATIAGLPTTETCYTDAISMLQQRFGDKQKIEQHHLTVLRHLPRVKSSNDVQGLRKLYDSTQLNVRCLVALGVSTSSFSAMLCNILLQALPYEIVLDYHRKRAGVVSTTSSASSSTASQTSTDVENLINFIRVELESRERITSLRIPDKEEVGEKRRSTSTCSGFALLNSESSQIAECCFCKSSKHNTSSCEKQIPLSEKKELLARDMRCFRCTTKGHRSRDCRRRITCSSCHGNHATTMCDPTWQRTKDTKPKTAVTASCHHQAVLGKYADEIGLQKTKLQQDIPTRWNSTFVMVNSPIETKDALRLTMNAENITPPLGDVEWGMLAQLRDVLQPLVHITNLLGGEAYVTRSVLIPTMKMLKRQMRVNNADASFVCRFKDICLLIELKRG